MANKSALLRVLFSRYNEPFDFEVLLAVTDDRAADEATDWINYVTHKDGLTKDVYPLGPGIWLWESFSGRADDGAFRRPDAAEMEALVRGEYPEAWLAGLVDASEPEAPGWREGPLEGEGRGWPKVWPWGTSHYSLEGVLALVDRCHDRVRGALSIMEPEDEKLTLLAANVLGVDMRDDGEFATLHEIGAVLQFAAGNRGNETALEKELRLRPHRILLYVHQGDLETFTVVEQWDGCGCAGEAFQCANVMAWGDEENPEYKKMLWVGRGLVLWEGFIDPEEGRLRGEYRRLAPEELAAIAEGRKPASWTRKAPADESTGAEK